MCTRENLSHALSLVSGVVQKQTHLPILTNILFRAAESKVDIFATNLDIAVRVSVRAKVEETGSFTVPARTLADYVALLPAEQVEIGLDGQELTVKSGSSQTKIKGMGDEEFPVIPDIEETHGYSIGAADLKSALASVGIAAAKNEIRPELAGVFFGFFTPRHKGLVLAATDSYRLAEQRVAVGQGADQVTCIVPGRTVSEMIRLISIAAGGEQAVRLWLSDSQIGIRYDQFEMTARLVDGAYPDYAQIIPEKFKTTATVPIAELTRRIKAASLFTTTGVNAVSFDLNTATGSLGISSTSTQTGEHSSEIDAEIAGEENSILLNHRYVLDGLQQMQSESVDFCVNSGDTPCLFRPHGGSAYVYIVMPIRQ